MYIPISALTDMIYKIICYIYAILFVFLDYSSFLASVTGFIPRKWESFIEYLWNGWMDRWMDRWIVDRQWVDNQPDGRR